MPAQERKFIGFREQLAQKRAQRYEGTEPEPWLVRKLAVIITICILGYVYYVFVVGVCVPMVREEQGRQGSKGQGVVYLVIYHLLWIMIIWVSVPLLSSEGWMCVAQVAVPSRTSWSCSQGQGTQRT